MWGKVKTKMRRAMSRVRAQEGQTLVEYALIIALVVLGTVVGLLALTGALNSFFSAVDTALNAA